MSSLISSEQLPGYPWLLCEASEGTAAAVLLETRQGLNKCEEVAWMYGTHLPFLESSSFPGLVYLGKRVICSTSNTQAGHESNWQAVVEDYDRYAVSPAITSGAAALLCQNRSRAQCGQVFVPP